MWHNIVNRISWIWTNCNNTICCVFPAQITELFIVRKSRHFRDPVPLLYLLLTILIIYFWTLILWMLHLNVLYYLILLSNNSFFVNFSTLLIRTILIYQCQSIPRRMDVCILKVKCVYIMQTISIIQNFKYGSASSFYKILL